MFAINREASTLEIKALFDVEADTNMILIAVTFSVHSLWVHDKCVKNVDNTCRSSHHQRIPHSLLVKRSFIEGFLRNC